MWVLFNLSSLSWYHLPLALDKALGVQSSVRGEEFIIPGRSATRSFEKCTILLPRPAGSHNGVWRLFIAPSKTWLKKTQSLPRIGSSGHSHNSPYAWLRQTSKFHQQASFVNKIFCICTFCAWVFFSTLLPWEFISVKLRLFLISKRGLVVKFACVT